MNIPNARGILAIYHHHTKNYVIMEIMTYGVMLAFLAKTTETKSWITIENTRTECYYQGEIYLEAQVVSHNCTDCTCARGQINCLQRECHKDPECIQYDSMPGSCCPECVEWGCHYGGAGYPRGARIPTPKCHFCFCPWKGGNKGHPVCSKVQCPAANCVDGSVPVGKCCPDCPNGSNCWMGDLLIAHGEEVWVSPCRSCKCQPEVENGFAELKGKCSWRFEQKNCPYGK